MACVFPNVPRRTHGFVFISACDYIGLARFEVGPVERNPLNYAHALAAAGLAPSLMLAASAAFARVELERIYKAELELTRAQLRSEEAEGSTHNAEANISEYAGAAVPRAAARECEIVTSASQALSHCTSEYYLNGRYSGPR